MACARSQGPRRKLCTPRVTAKMVDESNLQKAISQKYGIPYTIKTPEQPYLVVSSKEQIRDISNDAEHRLSLVAVAEEASSRPWRGTQRQHFDGETDLSTQAYHERHRDERTGDASKTAAKDDSETSAINSDDEETHAARILVCSTRLRQTRGHMDPAAQLRHDDENHQSGECLHVLWP